jgi:hypothetical protein
MHHELFVVTLVALSFARNFDRSVGSGQSSPQDGLAAAKGKGRYATMADLSGMNRLWLITTQINRGNLSLAHNFKIDVK